MTTWFTEDDQEEEYKPWTLADIYADLVSFSDICAGLDVTRWRLQSWIDRRERIHCPQPIKRLGQVDVYSMQEWKDWFRAWTDKNKPGRREGSKWVDTKPHDSGRPFFEYDPSTDE